MKAKTTKQVSAPSTRFAASAGIASAKAKTSKQASAPGTRPLEIAFITLPLLVPLMFYVISAWLEGHPERLNIKLIFALCFPLVPNLFQNPILSYNGLATQEAVFAWMTAALLAVALLQAVRSREVWQLSRQQMLMIAPLVAFCLWQGLSLLWSADSSEGLRVAGIWLGFTTFFIVGLTNLRLRSIQWLHYSLTLVTFLLASFQIYEYITYGDAILGFYFSHGITSELLSLLLPIQVAAILTPKRMWLVAISLLISALGGVALLLTLRRGPLLGTVVALVGLGLTFLFKGFKPQNKWQLAAVTAAILVTLGSVGVYRREALIERFKGAVRIQTAGQGAAGELGLTSRLTKWATGWEMAKHNLLTGVGNGGFAANYGHYRKYFVENPHYAIVAAAAEAEDYDEIRSPLAHSEYLEILAELGLVGLALFFIFWAQVGWRMWQQWRAPNNQLMLGALFGLLSFGINSAISGFSLRFTPGAFLAACVACLGLAIAREKAGQADEQAPADRLFSLPKLAVAAGLLVTLMAGVLLIGRAQNVLASQKAQSQLDLVFSLQPADNEILLRRYQRVLELDPYNAGAHLGLGLLLYQMKRVNECIPHVEYAFKHDYGRPFAYALLAFAYEQAGKTDQATGLLADCLTSFPRSVFARACYAEFLRKQGKIDEARQQQMIAQGLEDRLARSWALALRMKGEAATAEAAKLGLIPPDNLSPVLARSLVQARAYHYLR